MASILGILVRLPEYARILMTIVRLFPVAMSMVREIHKAIADVEDVKSTPAALDGAITAAKDGNLKDLARMYLRAKQK